MVTTGTTYLDTVTVIVIVIENILSSLFLPANEIWGKVMF